MYMLRADESAGIDLPAPGVFLHGIDHGLSALGGGQEAFHGVGVACSLNRQGRPHAQAGEDGAHQAVRGRDLFRAVDARGDDGGDAELLRLECQIGAEISNDL